MLVGWGGGFKRACSLPMAAIEPTTGLEVEEFELLTDPPTGPSFESPQAWMPVRVARRAGHPRPLPAVVLLHATSSDMDALAPQAAALAARGYAAVCVDCRYHGRRARGPGGTGFDGYQAALVAAWRGSGEHPFLLDNVWDLMGLADYLCGARPGDIDPARIGVTGVSLGGMHAWLWAAADPRVAAAAPMIGVQNFKCAGVAAPGGWSGVDGGLRGCATGEGKVLRRCWCCGGFGFETNRRRSMRANELAPMPSASPQSPRRWHAGMPWTTTCSMPGCPASPWCSRPPHGMRGTVP